MFELLRTPYRPPKDMQTLLGQEKYWLEALMILLATVWSLVVAWILQLTRLTIRDYFAFAAMVAHITSVALYLINNPIWPVTPRELLWS